jgi:hypothetical protein
MERSPNSATTAAQVIGRPDENKHPHEDDEDDHEG